MWTNFFQEGCGIQISSDISHFIFHGFLSFFGGGGRGGEMTKDATEMQVFIAGFITTKL